MRAMLPPKRQRVVGTAAMAVYLIAFAMSEDSGADARRGRMCQRIETTLLGQRITPTAYAIDGDDIAQIECRDTDEIRDFLRRDLSDEDELFVFALSKEQPWAGDGGPAAQNWLRDHMNRPDQETFMKVIRDLGSQ